MSKNVVFDIHPSGKFGWNRPKQKISLRREFYRKHPWATGIATLSVVLAGVLVADTFLGRANTVYWYPQGCLGGWSYVENAAGAPELSLDAPIEDFNANNSAILNNKVSQIFCGQFQGAIPEGAIPSAAYLELSLALKEPSDPEVNDPPDVPVSASEETPTTTIIITEPGSSSTEATTTEGAPAEEPLAPEEGSEPAPAEPEPQPEPELPSEPEPVPEPAPETSTFKFFPLAFAQGTGETTETPAGPDDSAPVEPPSEPEPAPEPELQPSQTSSTEPEPQPEPDPVVEGTSTVAGASSTAEAEAEPAPSIPAERDILEVRYSVDGENWQLLGTVTDFNWQNARFQIPLASWDAFEDLQISLVSLPVSDVLPVVYLDGMSIAIDHKPAVPVEPEEFDFEASNVKVVVGVEKEVKIDTAGIKVQMPEGAGELQFFAVPSECFGDIGYIKEKIFTPPYCGDPIGFPIFKPQDYFWKLDRPIRIAIGACRSEEACQEEPEDFILGFVSNEILSSDLAAGEYVLTPLWQASASVPVTASSTAPATTTTAAVVTTTESIATTTNDAQP